MGKNKPKFKERSYAREQLMQLLFQMEVQNDFSDAKKQSFIDIYMINATEIEYFNQVYALVIKNKEEIDDIIRKFSKNWVFERISKVDLSIMRLSLAEIIYSDDVPNSVSINEAVEMAKKFGGENSGKFINGILGEVTRSKDI